MKENLEQMAKQYKAVVEQIRKEREQLGLEISNTLQKALAYQGSTFNIQPFQNPEGIEGSAQNWHKVYAKETQLCQNCKTKISRIKQNGRSTFFCPSCQK